MNIKASNINIFWGISLPFLFNSAYSNLPHCYMYIVYLVMFWFTLDFIIQNEVFSIVTACYILYVLNIVNK
jgi:hypothetical protein